MEVDCSDNEHVDEPVRGMEIDEYEGLENGDLDDYDDEDCDSGVESGIEMSDVDVEM